MSDGRRNRWQSLVLHAVLIGGAVVFVLPYAWLAGTSFKLDREVQRPGFRILPERPVPATKSPYMDTRRFAGIERPASASPRAWDDWMQQAMRDEVEMLLDLWERGRDESVEADGVRETVAAGVVSRLPHLLPDAAWQSADEMTFRDALRPILTPDLAAESFDRAYRYLALGGLRLRTRDYQLHDALDGGSPALAWRVPDSRAAGQEGPASSDGEVLFHHGKRALPDGQPAMLLERIEAQRPVAVVEYDLDTDDGFELTLDAEVDFDLDDEAAGLHRIELSYRGDASWHAMRLLVEMNGRLYRSASPRYLTEEDWAEVRFQWPGPEDRQLTPRRYVLFQQADAGAQYDHGPRTLRLRLQVKRSGPLRAVWAKFTENYRTAFAEVPFWRYFRTSTFLVLINVLGTLLSCSLAAYALSRLNWPGRDLCFILVLATLMIPPQVTMIPSFVIYRYLGWYNTLMPLWVPSFLSVNAFGIFLLRQAMKGIPRELEEAAKIDGCGHLRIYWDIVLPLVRPTMAAIGIFTFMFVWNDFMTPLIYVNDQRLYPLALGLFAFMAGRESQFTLIMAGSVIMTLPVILIFFLAQRQFIQGVTMSGMKN